MKSPNKGLKSFVQGAAAASAMAAAVPATAHANSAAPAKSPMIEYVLEEGGPVFVGTEADYREAKRNAAYWKAGTHPKANKGYHGKTYKHTGTVLDHLKDPSATLKSLLKDKPDLQERVDGLSLSEQNNVLLYMLTAYHENREEGFLGMVAVTRVLENRVNNRYRGGTSVEEQLAQVAQFTYVGTTPVKDLTNGASEPKMWELAFRVGYYTVKGAEVSQSRDILTDQQLADAAYLKKEMGACMHYLTEKAAENNGRLNEAQFRGHGILKTREGSKHLYLIPPEEHEIAGR